MHYTNRHWRHQLWGTGAPAPWTYNNLFLQCILDLHKVWQRLYVNSRLVQTPSNLCAPPGTKSWRRHCKSTYTVYCNSSAVPADAHGCVSWHGGDGDRVSWPGVVVCILIVVCVIHVVHSGQDEQWVEAVNAAGLRVEGGIHDEEAAVDERTSSAAHDCNCSSDSTANVRHQCGQSVCQPPR